MKLHIKNYEINKINYFLTNYIMKKILNRKTIQISIGQTPLTPLVRGGQNSSFPLSTGYISITRGIEGICSKKAFTLIELIVVITILVVLWAVWFVSYESQIESSKNTARVTDLSNLWIWLKNHKLKNWVYPFPWDYFNIINSWSSNKVAYQWFVNDKLYSTELVKIPYDPDLSIPYLYSTSSNRNYYQLRTTIFPEDDSWISKAYLIWDYATVSKDVLPTLILAIATWATNNIEIASWTTDWDLNRLKFIVNNWTLNLAYTEDDNNPFADALSFSEIISETGIDYSKYPGYSTCLEIYEAWRSIWAWTYQILSSTWSVTNTWCTMRY